MSEEPKKNRGGRPTKLTQAMVDSAYEYLEEIESDYITVKRGMDKDGETRWEQTAPMLPNHARLAYRLGISKDTMYEWCREHEGDDDELTTLRSEFSHCLSRVKAMQEAMLNENGAAGVFNPAVSNRILAAMHGYKDKVDTTSDDKPLQNSTTVLVAADEKVQSAIAAFEEALRPKRKE
jgi:hypothetical protein